jgi:fluoride exporter
VVGLTARSGFPDSHGIPPTFSYETLVLARSGARTMALINVVASVLAGFGAANCGMAIAQAIQLRHHPASMARGALAP